MKKKIRRITKYCRYPLVRVVLFQLLLFIRSFLLFSFVDFFVSIFFVVVFLFCCCLCCWCCCCCLVCFFWVQLKYRFDDLNAFNAFRTNCDANVFISTKIKNKLVFFLSLSLFWSVMMDLLVFAKLIPSFVDSSSPKDTYPQPVTSASEPKLKAFNNLLIDF